MSSQLKRMSRSAGATSLHWRVSSRAANPMTTAATSHCAMRATLPFGSGNDGSIDTGVATRGGLRSETSECDDATCSAEIRATIWAIQQRIERAGQRIDVAGWNEHTSSIVLHGVCEPT